jgi:hypothetical protein
LKPFIETTKVVINTQMTKVHCWPECPFDDVSFLQHPHRHTFHIRVKIPVYHDDRDTEFIQFKNKLDEFLYTRFPSDIGRTSCEMICKNILDHFDNISYVRVMEDNENGAEKTRTRV